jgi:hypothetical protein
MKVTRILMALALTLFMTSVKSAFAHPRVAPQQEANETGNINHVEGLNVEDIGDKDMDDRDDKDVDDGDHDNVGVTEKDGLNNDDHADRNAQ